MFWDPCVRIWDFLLLLGLRNFFCCIFGAREHSVSLVSSGGDINGSGIIVRNAHVKTRNVSVCHFHLFSIEGIWYHLVSHRN